MCLYSKVVYEDAHKQAPRGEIAATRYISSPKNAFAAGALPRTPLGQLTALPRLPSW